MLSDSVFTHQGNMLLLAAVRPRWTSTLSITTWKKSGETRAKSWRKKEATSNLAQQALDRRAELMAEGSAWSEEVLAAASQSI